MPSIPNERRLTARPHVGIKSLFMSMAAPDYLQSRSRPTKLRLAHTVRAARHATGRPLVRTLIIISLPFGPGRNGFGPAVVRVRTAKSAVASDHLLHAHFVGWQTAIVMKGTARISARAPRHLSGLADAKVEQHCHRYGHYDEH